MNEMQKESLKKKEQRRNKMRVEKDRSNLVITLMYPEIILKKTRKSLKVSM